MNIKEIDFDDAHRQLYRKFSGIADRPSEWYAYEILSAISSIFGVCASDKVAEIALIMEEIGILNTRKIGPMKVYSVNKPK